MTKIAPLSDTFMLLLAETPAPGGPGGGTSMIMVGYGLLLVAMYFFMIAPQRKKAKEHQKMMESITSGDEIITTGGIYGEVTNKKDDRFVIRVSEGTKIEVGKSFIHAVVRKSGEEKK